MSEIRIPKQPPTYYATNVQAERLNRRPKGPLDAFDRDSRLLCASKLFRQTIYAFSVEIREMGHLIGEIGTALRYTVRGESEIAGWHATWALDHLGSLLLRPIAQTKDNMFFALGIINPNLAWSNEERPLD